MGRYSSVQTFADNNNKVAPIPYSSTARATDGSNTSKGIKVPKVNNVTGSSAGSNSSDFHIYRQFRRMENDRIEQLTINHQYSIAEAEYQAKIQLNKEECDERTRKRAEKRRKQKERQKLKRKRTDNGNKDDDDDNENDDDEENTSDDEKKEGETVPNNDASHTKLESTTSMTGTIETIATKTTLLSNSTVTNTDSLSSSSQTASTTSSSSSSSSLSNENGTTLTSTTTTATVPSTDHSAAESPIEIKNDGSFLAQFMSLQK